VPNSDDSKSTLSRRDALRLATAVSALGLGLGVGLGGVEAEVREAVAGAGIQLKRSEGSQVTIKTYRPAAAGKPAELLHTLDITPDFGADLTKESAVEIKLYSAATIKGKLDRSAGAVLLMQQVIKLGPDSNSTK